MLLRTKTDTKPSYTAWKRKGMLALMTLMAGGVGDSSSVKYHRPVQQVAFKVVVTPVKGRRSYSKDSHKSSHSDLSLMCNGGGAIVGPTSRSSTSVSGSGSPKLLANTQL
ncbi:hypothetical protein M5D96_004397, partial [Drosophila gunungcola]